MILFIYALCDPRTGEIRYIGKAKDYKDRLRKHARDRVASHKANWIASLAALDLLPILEVLEEVQVEHWREAERFWIAYARFLGFRLTNIAPGGDGADSISPETVEKQRRIWKSRIDNSERLRALNATRVGHPLSEEHRAKISAWGKGKRTLASTKEKMRAAAIGKPKSAEARARMSAAKKGKPGRRQAWAEKLKRSLTMTGRPKKKTARRIQQGGSGNS